MPYTKAQVRALFAKYSKAKARRLVQEGGVKRDGASKTKKVKKGGS